MERGSILAIVVASFLWTAAATAAASAQEPGAKDDGPEDRLLRAQLLEISTGDIEKAKTVYQAIQGDEKAPESTRALALLYLARCHRKLGEIDSAKKVLDELVRTHEKQRDVIRQARSFLRELTSGKPESPDFDWLKELEKSPEIQARVFDLAMDLTERHTEAGGRAWRQLIALGTIGVPVIEKVLESTRSPSHRQQLALLLVRLGRFERLPIVLDPRLPPSGGHPLIDDLLAFQGMVLTMEESERARLRTELERLPSAEATAPYRDALLLAAGDRSALAQKLASIEKISFSFLGSNLLDGVLKEEPSAIDVLLGRILDPGSDFKKHYFDAVLRKDPARLAVEHWMAVMSPKTYDSNSNQYVDGIEERGGFALLARLAALPGDEHKRNTERFVSRFHSKYIKAGKLATAPTGWAAVLRAAAATVPEAGKSLRAFAEENDAVVADFAEFLRNGMEEAPHALAQMRFRQSSRAPSPRLIDAMARLLDIEHDSVKFIALSILAEARNETPAMVFEAIENLRKQSDNFQVRQDALSALLRQFQAGRDIGPRLASAFIEEHERAIREEKEEAASGTQPAPQPQRRTIKKALPLRGGKVSTSVAIPLPRSQGFHQFLLGCDLDGRKALYPHVITLADSDEAGSRFHDVYFRTFVGDAMAAVAPQFARALESARTKPFRESAVHLISDLKPSFPKEDGSRVLAFLRAAAVDESLDVKARLKAFFYSDEPPLEWFDWEKFLGGSDPLASGFFTSGGVSFGLGHVVNEPSDPTQKRHGLPTRLDVWLDAKPDAEKERIYQAALRSPQPHVRRFSVMAYPTDRPGALDLLRRALSDGDSSVRNQGIEKLKHTTRGDLAPLAVELLKNPDRWMRLSGIELQKRFLSPEGIEPLAALLSDSDVEVRSKALEALREVRKAFEEKKEWELIRQGLLPSPVPPPKKDAQKKEL